jgi:hypothetical protein
MIFRDAILLTWLLVSSMSLVAKKTEQDTTLPSEVIQVLDQHADELIQMLKNCRESEGHCPTETGIRHFPWLPQYLVKHTIDRLEGVEILQKCIEYYSLDRLTVPKKYLYHVPGRPSKLSNANYLVIVPVIKRMPERPLTVEEVEQLCVLIHETYFWDIYSENLFFSEDGKITLIDTELRSFKKHKILDALMRFLDHTGKIVHQYGLEDDAFTFIFAEIARYGKDHPEQKNAITRRLKEALNAVEDISKCTIFAQLVEAL